nr:hypothetical protein [Tanacetum cinerariifolium]
MILIYNTTTTNSYPRTTITTQFCNLCKRSHMNIFRVVVKEEILYNNIMDGYFKWKDEITFGNASFFPGPSNSSSRASSSSGSSGAAQSPGNTKFSNCTLLTMKIKILEARLAMEKNPDDHACQSAAILHELLNEMKNLRVEW